MKSRISGILKSEFNKDLLITITGQIVVLIVAFALNKIVSYYLGTESYGIYTISKRSAGLISYLILFGIGIAIPKYLAISIEKNDEIDESRYILSALIMMFSISLVLLGFVLIFKKFFTMIIFGSLKYEELLLPIFMYSISLSFITFIYSYYRGVNNFYKYNIFQISVQIIVLVIAFVYHENVKEILVLWSSFIGVVSFMFLAIIISKKVRTARISFPYKDLWPYIKELFSFCAPRVPGEFVLFSFTLIPLIIINHRFGLLESSTFSAATTINNMLNPFFSFIGLILLPFVSKKIVNGGFDEVVTKVNILMKIYIVFSLIAIIGVVILTPMIVEILFSKEFLFLVPVVRHLVVTILPYSLYLLLRNPIDGASKFPYNTINLIISFVLMNITLLLVTNTVGIELAFLLGYFCLGILSYLAWNKIKKNERKKIQ